MNLFFNAHHSPMGAFASFTLGFPGRCGGLGMELGKPADQDVYIGLEAETPDVFEAMPFFEGFKDSNQDFGLLEASKARARIRTFAAEKMQRHFNLSSDVWTCGDLTFAVYNPVHSIPDPLHDDAEALKNALLPAVIAEMTIDNRHCNRDRRAFFGFRGTDPYSAMRRLDDTANGRLVGIAQGKRYALAAEDHRLQSGLGFNVEDILNPIDPVNLNFGVGGVGAIVAEVPAGQVRTVRFAICFFSGDIATAGWDSRYYYTRYFKCIEDVARHALTHFDLYRQWAQQSDERLDKAVLSEDQKFMIAHAVHSYYGSTQLLEAEGKPVWVVNEGEYRMMNTLDLTADQLFFEMTMNPWTVRNVLDTFYNRYSYRDRVRFSGHREEHPGGLSFTHDMGIANVFWKPGYSCYEQFGLTGCFSHMTCEELVNWVCCATAYVEQTQDAEWLGRRLDVLAQCLESLIHRDHPDPAQRNGVMGLDSSRCKGGSEITTYDSLDVSLGQARNNVYLAVKTMAAYLGLARVFEGAGQSDLEAMARQQADRCAATLMRHVSPAGLLPAVIDENVDSRILPVVEGLAFAWFSGCQKELRLEGQYGEFLRMLKTHLESVLKKGICLFEDGGWKISSTSNNSWLSKIYLCQFVARHLLKMEWTEAHRAADATHVRWLTDEKLSYWCWSDQIIAGKITASKYYPRGVSSILWLYEQESENRIVSVFQGSK